ncbi:uncharacterized protein LOC144313622 isoform X2 [Canis aureus]
MDTGTVENLGLFMQSIYQRYHKTSVPFTLITASLEMSVPVSVLTATGAGSCQDLLRSLIEVYVITACLGEILNQTIALEHWNREFNQSHSHFLDFPATRAHLIWSLSQPPLQIPASRASVSIER